MSEMVERVARALCAMASPDENYIETHWENWTDEARAAIEAMREPTSEMIEAALMAGTNLTTRGPSETLGRRTAGERMADQLRAAIDEALKD